MKKFTEDKLFELVLKQFEIIWVEMDKETLKNTDQFYNKYEMTEEQNKQWREYLKKEIIKYIIPCRLEKEIGKFDLAYWLKIKG